jgi:hypothetical protein
MTRARDVAGYISNVNAAGKNILLNGSFDHWQRGNARTYMFNGMYLADRWTGAELYQQSGHQRVALGYVNSELNSQYALRVTSSSLAENGGGTRMRTTQKVESINTYQLRGKKVTLSFWVRFSAATIPSITNSTNSAYSGWSGVIGYYTASTDGAIGTTPDDSSSVLTIAQGSFPTSWTKYTVTGTVPTNANNVSAYFGFATLGSTTASSDAWYEIANVQLETGSIATSFSRAGGSIGAELALCQRYYQQINSANPDAAFPIVREATTTAVLPLYLPVTMRTTPALQTTAGYGRIVAYDTAFSLTTSVVSAAAVKTSALNNSMIEVGLTHGTLAGTYVHCQWDPLGGGLLGLSSEL